MSLCWAFSCDGQGKELVNALHLRKSSQRQKNKGVCVCVISQL